VGADAWSAGEHRHHEPSHQAHRLDAGKKSLAASERREEERASWWEQVKPLDAKQLVFVDESGSNIALTPLYARAPKGQRAAGSVPRNRGKNTTLLASVSVEGLGASMLLEGATNTAAFEVYLEQILLPSLAPGQIVVMDNLSAHKGARVHQLIEERGCQLLFLPAYSPDFSPIEETKSCAQGLSQAGGRQDTGGPGRSPGPSVGDRDLQGCSRRVHSLWLLAFHRKGRLAHRLNLSEEPRTLLTVTIVPLNQNHCRDGWEFLAWSGSGNSPGRGQKPHLVSVPLAE